MLPNIEDLKTSVKRGAALLDVEKPGWRIQIDPHILDISSCAQCVLGQIGAAIYDYNTYSRILEAIYTGDYEDSYDFAVDHGFDGAPDEMELLTQLWLEELGR